MKIHINGINDVSSNQLPSMKQMQSSFNGIRSQAANCHSAFWEISGSFQAFIFHPGLQ